MSDLWKKRITRRDALAGAASLGAGLAAAACGAPGASSGGGGGGSAAQGTKELKILQWSHFIPAYDKWFDQFVEDWGKNNGVAASVDHISVDDLPARLAAEVSAQGGHDLVEMAGQVLTYIYEKQLVDMGDIVDYAVSKLGPVEPIAKPIAQVNGRWRAWADFYIAIMPQVRTDLFQQFGFDPAKVKTWADYLKVGTEAKKNGHAAGLAISHCNDANHNWRAVMWSFGASEVKEDGKTLNVDTKQMREFLSFAQEFYTKANTEQVFAWDNASDNRWLASGTGVFIHDAISSMRSVQPTNPDLYKKFGLQPGVVGPASSQPVMGPDVNAYTIWTFAKNQVNAKKFLRHYIDNYMTAFQNSQVYNMPTHANPWKNPIFSDPKYGGKYADPTYKSMQSYRGPNAHVFGYPGPPNYAANQTLASFVIPDMVATAVKQPGNAGVEAAISFAKGKLGQYYKPG
jgi:multiple sugar transport system substrate-binding protein